MPISQDNGQDRPPDRNRSRWKERLKLIGISVGINGLILLAVFLIVFPPKSPPPPKVIVAIREAPKPPDDLENQTIQKREPFFASDNAAAGMVLPVTALLSPIAIEVPDVASDIGGLPGLLSGFGDGDGTEGRGGDGIIGFVGGMNVRAVKLGIVLDVSGSMKDDLPAVRRELLDQFWNTEVVEVNGCRLHWKGPVEFDPAETRRKTKGQFSAPSTLQAIERLIAHERTDAIYWFADLQDDQDEAGRKRLIHLLALNPENTRRPVRFYIQSVQHEPGDVLKEIVKRSGGDFRFPGSKEGNSKLSSRSATKLDF